MLALLCINHLYQKKPYQKSIVVVLAGLVLIGLVAKMLILPSDLIKLKQSLPIAAGEDLSRFEDLFKGKQPTPGAVVKKSHAIRLLSNIT